MGEGLEYVFWVVAITGTAVFVLKTFLMFMGSDSDSDVDIDIDGGEAEFGDGDVGHGSSPTVAFNLLSLQALAILAMGGGWMGVACMDSFGLAETESIVIAFAFGAALVFLVGKLLSKARGLESSGTLNVQNAVGKTGIVYFDIPAGGRGQVRLEVQGRMVTLNAKSSGETIETGATVRVDGVDGSDTLIVVAES